VLLFVVLYRTAAEQGAE